MKRDRRRRQYSISRLGLYDRCPQAYQIVYRDYIPRAESEALATGRALHELIEGYLLHLFEHKRQTDWEWAMNAAPPEANGDALNIWARFYNSFLLPQNLSRWGVEERLAFDRNWQPCPWDKGYFRMVVDWHFLQGDLAVVYDWKTNRVMPETVGKDLQLLTYGWGLKRTFYPEAREVLLRLHYLRYGKEREVLLTHLDLAAVPDELKARIEVIEGDHTFTPAPGSFCGWCGVTAHCPVMAQALVPVEVLAPASREQAEKAASLLLTLQRMEKDLAARLKDWVKENGAIQVGDLTYGPSQTVSYDLDTQAVVEFLLQEGFERTAIWPLLNITKTSLERGLKKLRRKDLAEQILSSAPTKVMEKIDFRKAIL